MFTPRWIIPGIFLLVTGVLVALTMTTAGEQIATDVAGINKEHPWQGGALGLKKGTKYSLTVEPQALCVNCKSDVRVQLLDGSNAVIDLDAEFSAESKQVESSFVTLDFEVPQTSQYQLRFELKSSNSGGERLAWKVERKPLMPLEPWPLGVGLLLFLTMTAWTWASSDAELLEALSKLGAGTRLTVRGEKGTVEKVTEYREAGYEPGVEFEMRMDDGSTRYLAMDRYEDYYEDYEGYEHGTIHHLLLLSQPLDGAALQQLAAQGRQTAIELAGQIWSLDDNNSGPTTAVIYAVGSVFQSTLLISCYAPSQQPFPSKPGDQWLELVDYRDGDTEWVLLEIISASEIGVDEAVEREIVTDDRLHELQQMAASARAARDRRDAQVAQRPFSQQRPQQQQQQPHMQQPHDTGDRNG